MDDWNSYFKYFPIPKIFDVETFGLNRNLRFSVLFIHLKFKGINFPCPPRKGIQKLVTQKSSNVGQFKI